MSGLEILAPIAALAGSAMSATGSIMFAISSFIDTTEVISPISGLAADAGRSGAGFEQAAGDSAAATSTAASARR